MNVSELTPVSFDTHYMDITTIIGASGAGIILLFFLLNQFKILSVDNVWYDLANTAGSALLIVYSFLLDSIPFLVLNIVWFLFSFKDVIVYFTKRS